MAAIVGASRVSSISVMFVGEKHRESIDLTDDCASIPDVMQDLRMKHESWKNGMECSSNAASNFRL